MLLCDYLLSIFYRGLAQKPTPPHTENKETKKQHSRMQGKRSKVKNFPSEECKQSKNHCSPVKLESKKND